MAKQGRELLEELPREKLPQIGRRQIVYRNKYQKIYKVKADFGVYKKEYFITEAGERAGIVAAREKLVLLVRQYRFLTNSLSYEIPGGRVDNGERPETAAVRECLEETGIRCVNPQPLLFYHPGLDTLRNPTYLFYSEEIAEEHELQRVHKREVSSSEWVALPRCIEMIFEKKILDAFSIVALLAYKNLKDRL